MFSESPKLSPVKIVEELTEGQRLSIVCSVVTGATPISFIWHKDGATTLQSDIKVETKEFRSILEVESLSAKHNGNYTCTAKNVFGSDQISVSVRTNSAPKWNSVTIKLDGVIGKSLVIDCSASGHPSVSVKILKGELFELSNMMTV